MVEKYVPKVGDKVRAALGENVLVGVVTYVGGQFGRAVALVPSGVEDVDPYVLSDADGWQFEQIVSVPTKFGAVIRRADAEVFALIDRTVPDGRAWVQMAPNSLHMKWNWVNRQDATAGGFTVLFEGVDE